MYADIDRNPEALRRAVAGRKWFHTLNLGQGVVTPGLDDSFTKLTWLGLPPDLRGLSVLDVGAWDGFFSFEAERRGARVLATDSYCWTGQGIQDKGGFDLAKTALNSRVEERILRVEDIPNAGLEQFDIVLFLGVLYHAPDPLGYLRAMRSVTRGFMIIETHVDLLDVDRPALAYYPGDMLNGDGSNYFGPNALAVSGMCRDAGFSRVEKIEAPTPPSRMVFHAFA
jgi:tRNA (mo5U34)-methyltransferase